MPLRSLRWRGWRTRHEVQLQLAVSPLIAGAAPSPTVTALPRLCSCPHLHALGPAACQGACLRLGVYRLARLNQWAKAGVFDQVHLEVLDRLGLAGRLDWSSASVDWASVRAKRGGTTLAQIPSIVTSQGPSSTWSATAANRACLRRRGITLRIARRGVESSTRLGRHRWRVERTLSWLSCYRRLAVRWDRDSKRWFGFVLLACALVCFKALPPTGPK
jgi:transposase